MGCVSTVSVVLGSKLLESWLVILSALVMCILADNYH